MISLYALARILCVTIGFAGVAPKTRLIHFKTSDGWNIAGVYYAPPKAKGAVVLVHGVGAGFGEWDTLEPKLWEMGLGTLAIDLRGHGNSALAGKKKWSQFSDSDWASAQKDVESAVRFLNKRGFKAKQIGLIGGSIGANLASRVADQLKLPWAALLSPGQEYRGVRLRIPQNVRLCVAASPQDSYAFQTALSLVTMPNVVFLQASSGHGAQMLAHPGFVDRLLSWIAKNSAVSQKR